MTPKIHEWIAKASGVDPKNWVEVKAEVIRPWYELICRNCTPKFPAGLSDTYYTRVTLRLECDSLIMYGKCRTCKTVYYRIMERRPRIPFPYNVAMWLYTFVEPGDVFEEFEGTSVGGRQNIWVYKGQNYGLTIHKVNKTLYYQASKNLWTLGLDIPKWLDAETIWSFEKQWWLFEDASVYVDWLMEQEQVWWERIRIVDRERYVMHLWRELQPDHRVLLTEDFKSFYIGQLKNGVIQLEAFDLFDFKPTHFMEFSDVRPKRGN